jgi:hypothetical protein
MRMPQRTQVCIVGLDGQGEEGGQHVLDRPRMLLGSAGCLSRNGVDELVEDFIYSRSRQAFVSVCSSAHGGNTLKQT